jgi:hypothetical protein
MMTQREKQELLDLFSMAANWCQETEARNWQGESVRYDDPSAVAWDLTGGVCHLFGWERATELFPLMERHVTGRKPDEHATNPGIASMIGLQEFNDSSDTSFEILLLRLQSVPASIDSVHETAESAPVVS